MSSQVRSWSPLLQPPALAGGGGGWGSRGEGGEEGLVVELDGGVETRETLSGCGEEARRIGPVTVVLLGVVVFLTSREIFSSSPPASEMRVLELS